ncbi:hypothetical protein N474_15105 [Pseudoalteromonas luteoviolacea CPMOR-2]|uniref:Ig-like domain-containing protein n=1 Tax=Pseudoalteromonas luteoviolacea DSM 6061 TaxID=1365250 RepID=A0A166X665_9GAMM|nr:hypothetical protein [Pseudoalteromonas luteoviolacea]KZN39716.1 hypothetical protein N475_13230 [Pseudoalteromonas luteoviolacea DSM 6061]KZN55312.1 hypothetical protein N474_15105 [Pseudoalteromonas luteoviolacea CPMOR-2]MBE0385647.1 hypothetical protein [Pseudoalteromonas luteoviolacea DSM 6061]
MKTYSILAAIGLSIASISSQAAVVECVISGTPTPQEWSANFCSSPTVSPVSSVVFRLNASKPIAEVTWSYYGSSGRWDCNNGQYCRFTNSSRQPSGNAEACARRVLYTDGTWESLNSCAYGTYWYGNGPILKQFDIEVSEESLSSSASHLN